MHLIFNELSMSPLPEDAQIGFARFKQLLMTFNKAKTKHEFKHIRFPQNYSQLPVTTTQSFYEWISALPHSTHKSLMLALFRQPFTDELQSEEEETFVQSTYRIAGSECPAHDSPFGLPIAHIKSLPVISLDNHPFWRNRIIAILKSCGDGADTVEFQVRNICMEEDVDAEEFQQWVNDSRFHIIEDVLTLLKYLNYARFKAEFTDDFMEQFFEWKNKDVETYKRILSLMKDVELHPFSGGMGKTENLKNRGKEASKRITGADRLSYSLENDVITFIACKGHYEYLA